MKYFYSKMCVYKDDDNVIKEKDVRDSLKKYIGTMTKGVIRL